MGAANRIICCSPPPQTRAAKGFAVLSLVFFLIFLPVERLATREGNLVRAMQLLALPSSSPC